MDTAAPERQHCRLRQSNAQLAGADAPDSTFVTPLGQSSQCNARIGLHSKTHSKASSREEMISNLFLVKHQSVSESCVALLEHVQCFT